MKAVFKALVLPVLALLAAGCEVNVDNQSRADLENAADSLGTAADSAANTVGNVAERAAGTIERTADDIDNRVDVNVNLHGDRGGGDNVAEANRH